jgi:hypothetical protein
MVTNMKSIRIGKRVSFSIFCDLEDVYRIQEWPWRVDISRNDGRIVVKGRVGFNKVSTTLGRFVLNYSGPLEVDHKDRNWRNFCKDNLRLATRAQQIANSGPRGLKNYKGTSKTKFGMFTARITIDDRTIHIGNYPTEELAAKAYDIKAKEFFGEFAYLNFPGEI